VVRRGTLTTTRPRSPPGAASLASGETATANEHDSFAPRRSVVIEGLLTTVADRIVRTGRSHGSILGFRGSTCSPLEKVIGNLPVDNLAGLVLRSPLSDDIPADNLPQFGHDFQQVVDER
jgi:hypothetical protein